MIIGAHVPLGRSVDPDLLAVQLDREDLHVVGKLVEGAPGTEIKASGVPVAGEDATGTGAAVEGEAHMRAAVVQSVDLAIGAPEHEGATIERDRHDAGRPKL